MRADVEVNKLLELFDIILEVGVIEPLIPLLVVLFREFNELVLFKELNDVEMLLLEVVEFKVATIDMS